MDGLEWFKGVYVEAYVGIRREVLDPVLSASGAPDAVFTYLDAYSQEEEYTTDLADAGYAEDATRPQILVLDVLGFQIDAGLNEVPRAVCELAQGRDGTALARGVGSDQAVSPAHVVEQYLGQFVEARIYARTTVTASSGPPGAVADAVDDPPEWAVLFLGYTNGTTRRGGPEEYKIVLHLTHFTGGLNFSSVLSGAIAPGTEVPYALSPNLFIGAAPAGGATFTPAGATAAGLANGAALFTDFWGYSASTGGPNPQVQGGLKQFLVNLANQDLFDWQAFKRFDLGAADCGPAAPRTNARALVALARIEPFAGSQRAADWATLQDAVYKTAAANAAAGETTGVDRADLTAAVDSAAAYAEVGYRYAVPVPFYLNQTALGPFSSAGSFAYDVCNATFPELAPSSFWDLLANRYVGRYQLALAPMAARGLIVPFQPIAGAAWQTVYASEVFSWDDDVQNTEPVRGVVLMSNRRSDAGSSTSGSAAGPSIYSIATADAAYDSCTDGVFLYRALPQWLTAATRQPAVWGAGSLGARVKAACPGIQAPLAAATVDRIVASVPAALGLPIGAAYAVLGVIQGAAAGVSEVTRSTANRVAQALFQQSRTGPHTAYATTRFRTDVAPGSVVDLELPADRYVKRALGALGADTNTRARGLVLRVSLSLNRESRQAVTGLQVGFLRTEPELRAGSATYADAHPFWATLCYGAPWADTFGLRARLGDRADINY